MVSVIAALVVVGLGLELLSIRTASRATRPAAAIALGVLGFAVLVGAGVVVVVVERITEPGESRPADPHPNSEFRVAVLGDSYTSGEGARRYFAETDEPSSNKCHRSASANGYLAAEEVGASLAFIACSGARTEHVTGRQRSLAGADPPNVRPQYPDSPDDVYGGRYQLEDLKALDPPPDAVVMGIGGNDAGFGDIGQGCATPTRPACQRTAQYWIDRLQNDVYPALVDTFGAVQAATNGPVFVTTYANPLGPEACRDVLLSESEFSFLRDVFIPRLNMMITFAAAVAGVRVIDLEHAMDGHRVCEVPLSQAGVNFIALGRTKGSTLELSLDGIRSLGHGTFHPNARGHRLLVDTVVRALHSARAGTLPDLGPPPPPGIPPPPYVPPEVGPPTGPHPFPAGTKCRGSELVRVDPVGADSVVERIAVSGAKPVSTVCFRTYQGSWRSTTVDSSGGVSVPIDVGASGIGSTNEVVIQDPNGTWRKVVVQNLGAPSPDEGRWLPDGLVPLVGIVVVAGVIVLAGIVIVIRRQRSSSG